MQDHTQQACTEYHVKYVNDNTFIRFTMLVNSHFNLFKERPYTLLNIFSYSAAYVCKHFAL